MKLELRETNEVVQLVVQYDRLSNVNQLAAVL